MRDPKRHLHDDPPGPFGGLVLITIIGACWLLVLSIATAVLHLSGPAEIAELASAATKKILAAVSVAGCALLLINHFR